MESVQLAQRRLVVAANRGPVSFHEDPSGEPVVTRGPGGLVTVLTEVLRHHPGTWVAAALSDAERRLAAEGRAVEVALDGEEYRVRHVAPSPEAYNKYYNIVANPMLWFIQHYLWDLGRHPDIGAIEMDAWHNGYLVVNEQFAKAVIDEVRRGPNGRRRRGPAGDGGDALVLLHDYQLYCVAPDVRAACPGAFLHQFVHIPWPQSDYWRVLPRTSGRRCSAAFSPTTWSPSTRATTCAISSAAAPTCSSSRLTMPVGSCATRIARCGCAPTR